MQRAEKPKQDVVEEMCKRIRKGVKFRAKRKLRQSQGYGDCDGDDDDDDACEGW